MGPIFGQASRTEQVLRPAGGAGRPRPTNLPPAAKMSGVHSSERLQSLGLTATEAEVLYWAAHGKSNQEVAMILGKTLNTVKKHVANLSLMAALQAAQVLEL